MRNIKPTNNNGSIQLKFSVDGKRYSFNPFAKSAFTDRRDIVKAGGVANQIEMDILAGCFDQTLDRYREKPKVPEVFSVKPTRVLEIWDAWITSLDLSDRSLNGQYATMRGYLTKSDPLITECASWMMSFKMWAPTTFNARCGYLRRCFRWAVNEGLCDINPIDKVKAKRASKTIVRPFTVDEIRMIVNAIRTDRFNPAASGYSHNIYADWVEFLFLTGCRPAEALGLQAKHIDLRKGHIEISSALARGDRGQTNPNARVRKGTKTGSVRFLPLTPRLRSLLEPRCAGLSPEALVFTNTGGNSIDDRMFGRRVWKTLLEGLGLTYRRLYTTRHTFASIALEQGTPIATVAYLLGHSDLTMVTKTYGHMVSRPQMPNILPEV